MRTESEYGVVHDLVAGLDLHTVCRSARCPNRRECWNRGAATLMILGDICTRNCRFCAVAKGRPEALDRDEPVRVVNAVREMGLRYVVLTSVTRDDLADGGSALFAEAICRIRAELPGVLVEVLTPDFQGRETSLGAIGRARPDVFAHNLETVRRLQSAIRPQASYDGSLDVLKRASGWRPAVVVKSGLMLGLGETDDEIREAMDDLLAAGCVLLTMGQYLAPTKRHAPVSRFVTPEAFEAFAETARRAGFKGVASAPLVRSSYRARELYEAATGA